MVFEWFHCVMAQEPVLAQDDIRLVPVEFESLRCAMVRLAQDDIHLALVEFG